MREVWLDLGGQLRPPPNQTWPTGMLAPPPERPNAIAPDRATLRGDWLRSAKSGVYYCVGMSVEMWRMGVVGHIRTVWLLELLVEHI